MLGEPLSLVYEIPETGESSSIIRLNDALDPKIMLFSTTRNFQIEDQI